jgi:NAD(P)-dependent dehydrogenase (short-subunit alcohol dehydrogenase family)
MTNQSIFSVCEEIIVITGVSGQLGHEYAKAFLSEGAIVAGLDINPSMEIQELEKLHPKSFHYFHADVTSLNSLSKALTSIEKKLGIPTVLINNAGLDSPPSSDASQNGAFEDYPESSWDRVIDVNLKGVYLCCQVFGTVMARAKKGSIINISSIYGLVSPDQSLYDYMRAEGNQFFKPIAYSASKSGILNITRYLATYWAKENIRVNSLTLAGVFNHQDDQFLEAYCSRIPIGRMADPKEYNGCLIFLASSASSYVTGSNLIADGGWTAI